MARAVERAHAKALQNSPSPQTWWIKFFELTNRRQTPSLVRKKKSRKLKKKKETSRISGQSWRSAALLIHRFAGHEQAKIPIHFWRLGHISLLVFTSHSLDLASPTRKLLFSSSFRHFSPHLFLLLCTRTFFFVYKFKCQLIGGWMRGHNREAGS